MTSPKPKSDTFGKITDEGIQKLRARIGAPIPEDTVWQGWHTVASNDAFRHFAYGYGDDNPVWYDADYAAKTRWRNPIAPPSFVDTMGICETPLPPGRRPSGLGGSSGLPGVHAFWSGDEVEWFRPVYQGDKLFKKRAISDVQLKKSEFAGTSAIVHDRTTYTNQRGELVVSWVRLFVRTEREKAAQKGKYSKIERATYTPERLAEIEADYDKEERRGSDSRYWEDVQVGQQIVPVVHGPLVVSDIFAWYQGHGRWELFPHKLALRNRRDHGGYYSLNDFGVPECTMRCHWDDAFARKIGNPYAYDMGILRNAWITHAITNWMGDDAWLWKLDDQYRRFNYIGDTTWIRGEVTKKYVKDERCVVELSLRCENQRNEITAPATATIILPSKEHGPVALPQPPKE